MKTNIVLLSILLLLSNSCKEATQSNEKELELKEKELALKEKELELKAKESEKTATVSTTTSQTTTQSPQPTTIQTPPPKIDAQLSNVEKLIGNWFVPHNAMTNMKFLRNKRFEFNDYNSKLQKEELLKGTYTLENGVLTLLYDDRPSQRFKFYKGEKGDANYYIKGSAGYYFVKGENGN